MNFFVFWDNIKRTLKKKYSNSREGEKNTAKRQKKRRLEKTEGK